MSKRTKDKDIDLSYIEPGEFWILKDILEKKNEKISS